jgi:hypothetical protein
MHKQTNNDKIENNSCLTVGNPLITFGRKSFLACQKKCFYTKSKLSKHKRNSWNHRLFQTNLPRYINNFPVEKSPTNLVCKRNARYACIHRSYFFILLLFIFWVIFLFNRAIIWRTFWTGWTYFWATFVYLLSKRPGHSFF